MPIAKRYLNAIEMNLDFCPLLKKLYTFNCVWKQKRTSLRTQKEH
jgi:hypothetical protein